MKTISKYFSSNWLFTEVDNSPLVIFRILFGLLCAAESYGAIMTGWVRRVMIEPEFTFTFIGFEWLQPLPGDGMYYYFAVMGTMGLLISLGLFYRVGAFGFFLMWTATYLMQKTSYNNHYYLLCLMSFVMGIMPAHRRFSLDVLFGFIVRKDTCPRICHKFWVFQVGLVYSFASFNKIYPDWLNAKPIGVWFNSKSGYWLIGPLLAQRWFQYAISYGGILYDGLITPILLFKRTRYLGVIFTLIFNLFNSWVFQIGIFPYLMISLLVFFFPPDEISRLFFRKRMPAKDKIYQGSNWSQSLWYYLFFGYVILQLALPFRHFFYYGDVHWTEEGHRMSWQMMLRAKGGFGHFKIINNDTGEKKKIFPMKEMTKKQARKVAAFPDFIYQYSRILEKKIREEEGWENFSIYLEGYVRLNQGERGRLVDPDVDLLKVEWDRWGRSEWINPFPPEEKEEKPAPEEKDEQNKN